MAKSGGKNPNVMAKVYCPTKRMEVWANSTVKGEFNCTGCGQTHTKAASTMVAEVTKTKKKKFKKGKKQK